MLTFFVLDRQSHPPQLSDASKLLIMHGLLSSKDKGLSINEFVSLLTCFPFQLACTLPLQFIIESMLPNIVEGEYTVLLARSIPENL